MNLYLSDFASMSWYDIMDRTDVCPGFSPKAWPKPVVSGVENFARLKPWIKLHKTMKKEELYLFANPNHITKRFVICSTLNLLFFLFN